MRTTPQTQYAQSGGLSIAYQDVGTGPALLLVPGFVSHVELMWELPAWGGFMERLARFSRLIVFDKRGMGLSDRNLGAGPLEDRMDDIRAVLDACEVERAAVIGISEGGPLSILFSATHPSECPTWCCTRRTRGVAGPVNESTGCASRSATDGGRG
jgi:pimeloyl-ACP methyl ester carboxylesterase